VNGNIHSPFSHYSADGFGFAFEIIPPLAALAISDDFSLMWIASGWPTTRSLLPQPWQVVASPATDQGSSVF
jgi:hypothetical protein